MHDLEKSRIQAEGRLQKKIPRKCAVRGTKILRPIQKKQIAPRQQQHRRIALQPPLTLIDHHLRMSLPTEENGTPLEAVGILLEVGKIGLADNELLLRRGD